MKFAWYSPPWQVPAPWRPRFRLSRDNRGRRAIVMQPPLLGELVIFGPARMVWCDCGDGIGRGANACSCSTCSILLEGRAEMLEAEVARLRRMPSEDPRGEFLRVVDWLDSRGALVMPGAGFGPYAENERAAAFADAYEKEAPTWTGR